jgi:hypothetical protein
MPPDASRLYSLLYTLVAVRMDLSRALKDTVATDGSGAAKVNEVRSLLDAAIKSTKDIIVSVERASAESSADALRTGLRKPGEI